MADPLLDRLRTIVGPAHVLVDADLIVGHCVDWTRRWRGTARGVVRPGSTAEVAAVVAACRAEGAAIVPQGGNTGLVGGGVPRAGEVLLSTLRLRHIGEVDVIGRRVVAGAGVTLASAQAAVAPHGFEVGVDHAARDSATLGGMVATNAGGIHVLRNGSMRRRIDGLEAVMADGSVVTRLAGLEKDNAGYDLAGLLCGSEGTLAVITTVALRLVPAPLARVTAAIGVGSTADAQAVVARLTARLPGLEAAEIVYADGVELVERALGVRSPLEGRWPALVIVEAGAWSGSACAALVDDLVEAVGTGPVAGATAVADEPASRARLWAVRERHTEAIATLGVPHKLDVSVPLRHLASFEVAVRRAVAQAAPAATCVLFGHVGDGNLHVNVVGPDPSDDAIDGVVLDVVADHGGSVSAEHGIGVAKVAWLDRCRGAADIAAMRAVKTALDPTGLLNPGVLFASVL